MSWSSVERSSCFIQGKGESELGLLQCCLCDACHSTACELMREVLFCMWSMLLLYMRHCLAAIHRSGLWGPHTSMAIKRPATCGNGRSIV